MATGVLSRCRCFRCGYEPVDLEIVLPRVPFCPRCAAQSWVSPDGSMVSMARRVMATTETPSTPDNDPPLPIPQITPEQWAEWARQGPPAWARDMEMVEHTSPPARMNVDTEELHRLLSEVRDTIDRRHAEEQARREAAVRERELRLERAKRMWLDLMDRPSIEMTARELVWLTRLGIMGRFRPGLEIPDPSEGLKEDYLLDPRNYERLEQIWRRVCDDGK